MKALITGITGQDGSYLAELLLEKGYEVHAIVRRASTTNYWRIEHLLDRIHLHPADLLDQLSVIRVIDAVRPHELYNLAAMSFVPASSTRSAGTTSTPSRRFPSCPRRGTSRCSPASSTRRG